MLLAQSIPQSLPERHDPHHSHHSQNFQGFPETAPSNPFSNSNHLALPKRFARVKEDLIAGKEAVVAASWKRLLVALRAEVDAIASTGSDIIPSIDHGHLCDEVRGAKFFSQLRVRGAAVIRNVVPREQAAQWKQDIDSYVDGSPRAQCLPSHDPDLHGIFWSPAQVKARADANILNVQRFVMNLWRSSDPEALISPSFPVSYADRLRVHSKKDSSFYMNAYVDGGSVERWESDGYGRGSTYQSIWDGKWEEHDPWESSTRLKVSSDLYNGVGSCNMFRMFQGWLSLDELPQGNKSLLLCPMLRLSTAYFLLRPFFAPIHNSPSHPDFLSPENWKLESPISPELHGALPSYTQEINDVLHPHLDLARSMVKIPHLRPGDYLIWHCDAVYAFDAARDPSIPDATILYLPACPLTQTNALYLARQRKAFVLGQSGPDFGGSHGESTHLGRPGVQDVSDAGGDEALRAMGLLQWDEEDAVDDTEQQVIEMANSILFPDMYGTDYRYM